MTILQAVDIVLRRFGRPATHTEIYEAIVQAGLYDFGAQEPAQVVGRKMRECVAPHAANPRYIKVAEATYALPVEVGPTHNLPNKVQQTVVSANDELEILLAHQRRIATASEAFDPKNIWDARTKTLGTIVRRQGREHFREGLLALYKSRCAVTGCDAQAALEAAHICPYKGPETDDLRNGLLLRADIHTLFDLGLLTIHPEDYVVLLSEPLLKSSYSVLNGNKIALPELQEMWPSPAALRVHRELCGF